MLTLYVGGYIGLGPFHHILTDPRVQGIPLILEDSGARDVGNGD